MDKFRIFTLNHFNSPMRLPIYLLITFCISLGLLPSKVQAQDKRNLIQLTGIIVAGEYSHGVPGAFIYAPKTGRGASSNYIGYFSLPAISGDTLIVKAIGFKQQYYVVPVATEKASVVITITTDALYLPMVEIFPWPTEQLFKEAFLALELDQSHRDYAAQNLNDMVLRRMLINLKDDGSLNHRYFLNQQYAVSSGAGVQQFGFLDPFAWRKFIESSKKGSLKQQDEKFKDKELEK